MRAQPAGTLRCVPGIMRRLFRRLFAYAVCVLRLRRFYHRGRQGALLFCRFLERAGAAPAGIGSAHAWTAGPGRRLGSVGSAHAWTAVPLRLFVEHGKRRFRPCVDGGFSKAAAPMGGSRLRRRGDGAAS